jgi:apolipoprotein N-acyltransferase
VILGVALAAGYGALRISRLPARSLGKVAAIQPSFAFSDKQNRELWNRIVDSLLHLSERAMDSTRPQLMTWPEAAVPYFFEFDPAWSSRIADQARRYQTPMLVGGLDLIRHSDSKYDYYNAAFLYDTAGRRDQTVYHKRFLVPIVERVPFVNPAWFSRYESAFESESRDYRARGADFLVNITNDAWFGRSSAPYQHAAHLVMRAIENRIGIARAANNGISEFVDPFGRTYDETRLDEVTFIANEVWTTDVRTVYTRLGDWVGILSLVGTLALAGFAARKRGEEGRGKREEANSH